MPDAQSTGGTAIVVLGNGSRRLGAARAISRSCLALVREAERLAETTPVDLVVFSGGSHRGRPSEAEQMRAAWRGPDVELALEPTASVTAENASRTIPLLLACGVERALVVCAPVHARRAGYFFTRLYGPRGIQAVVHHAPVRPRPKALAWELGALLLCRRQLRAAQSELASSASV